MSRNSEFASGQTYQADIEPVTAHVAAAYHNANGGSTFNALTGTPAKSGYAIGGMGVPETVVDSPSISPAQFQAHRDKVRAVHPSNLNAHAGTWVDNKSGKTVMDASQVETSRKTAGRIQAQRGEDAVFNLATVSEVDLRPKAQRSKRER